MRKAFFFDRDGTLNYGVYRNEQESGRIIDGAPFTASDFKIKENAREIVDFVREKGFFPIVITNQPDFLKKNLSLRDYEEITTKLCSELQISRSQIFECLHIEPFSLECDCRKSKPGLILMAKGLYDLDLGNSWYLGDSWKDMAAAENAGVKNTIFLKREPIEGKQAGNKDSQKKLLQLEITPKYIIADLSEILSLLK